MSQGKKTTKLTICILAHNSQDTIAQTIESCLVQDCEIAVMSNGCTDKTVEIAETYPVTIYDIPEDIGMPKNIERCFKLDADYIMLMCADDVLVDKNTAKIMKKTFDNDKLITHITRYYYQFLDGKYGPVRTWHEYNVFKLADNPSGLAFRVKAYHNYKVSDTPFVEALSLVNQFLTPTSRYAILMFDTVAVRVGNNASQRKETYNGSPTQAWIDVIGPQEFLFRQYVGFVQLKCWAGQAELIKEIKLFIKYRRRNLLSPKFWFFASGTLIIPSKILANMALFYKDRIGRHFCGIIENAYDNSSNPGV